MRKNAILQLQETFILKNDDLESSFDKNVRMFCKINFEAINLLQKANLNKSLL